MAPEMSTAGLLVLACIVTLHFADVARAWDVVPECPSEFEGKIAYPENCALYVKCSDGRASVKACRTRKVFNPTISDCDWSENVPECEDGGFIDLSNLASL